MALKGCPGILWVLGAVDFADSHGEGRRAPVVPHLQGFCTPWPVSDLGAYVHQLSVDDQDSVIKDERDRWYRPSPCQVQKFTTIASQLLSSLLAVQERGYVHQGLSMSNVFMIRDQRDLLELCISDLCYCTEKGTCTAAALQTSLAHTAPEVTLGHQKRADFPQMAWAAGVLLWEVCTGLPPACIVHRAGYLAALALPPAPECVGPALRAPGLDDRIDLVLRGLLNVDPKARMTLQEAASVMHSLHSDVHSASYTSALQVCNPRNVIVP